jgi:hypothetical protein
VAGFAIAETLGMKTNAKIKGRDAIESIELRFPTQKSREKSM